MLDEATARIMLEGVIALPREMRVELLDSGFTNANYKLSFADGRAPLVMRLLEHKDSERMQKEVRINSFVKNLSRPDFLFHADDSVLDMPFILMQYIEGTELSKLTLPLDEGQTDTLGISLGKNLQAIHSVKFAEAGFLNGRLIVDRPVNLNGRGLSAFAEQVLMEQGRAKLLGNSLARRILAFIEEEGTILDGETELPCLCHSDFGSSNILVDETRMEVAAVLDFEYAFSGNRYVDFGNLLRAPFSAEKGIKEAVARGYLEAGGKLPHDWYAKSLMTDLFAWFEFLSREDVSEEIVESVRIIFSRTITSWLDLV